MNGGDATPTNGRDHTSPPLRTPNELVEEPLGSARAQQPTLPDGLRGTSRLELAALSPGTLALPHAEVDDAAQESEIPTVRRPFSGFWVSDAPEASVDTVRFPASSALAQQLEQAPISELSSDALEPVYEGPELATAPRFTEEAALESSELEAVLEREPSSANAPFPLSRRALAPSSPSTPSLDTLRRSVVPAVESAQRTDSSDLDAALDELIEGSALVLGAPPGDLGEGGRWTPQASTLADATADDDTDPQIPSARRASQRARAPEPPLALPPPLYPLESVAPPPVSVTVPPPEGRLKLGARRASAAPLSRDVVWRAAAVIGAGAAAAALVLLAADVLPLDVQASTAVDVPPSEPVRPASAEVSGDRGTASFDAPGSAAAPGPAAATAGTAAAAAPLGHEPASSSSFSERMSRAAGEGEPRPGLEPASPSTVSATTPAVEPPASLAVPFDSAAASAALEAIAVRASACRQAGDPSGVARLVVTFSPTSGRATQATIAGAPFQGTPTGACIVRIAREASVAPYAGSYVTVGKTVVVR